MAARRVVEEQDAKVHRSTQANEAKQTDASSEAVYTKSVEAAYPSGRKKRHTEPGVGAAAGLVAGAAVGAALSGPLGAVVGGGLGLAVGAQMGQAIAEKRDAQDAPGKETGREVRDAPGHE
jgi:hypothetical protein